MENKASGHSRFWQKDLVLLAKNIYIWLHQLSRKYSRSIQRLDQIPDEELELMRSFGISGLWLVGIWQRSPASLRIKQLYGRDHLIASAYSINNYLVSEQLGGESALENLKSRALKKGIFIACDMVPNHTGVDAEWLLDHPDWYINSKTKPVDTWIYSSEDLSPRADTHIQLEDGYYSQQEAAEVFLYTSDMRSKPLYIYHGNDGTSMPWNDTAQLDYLQSQVREAVKKQILNVAQRFPVIRLDAAMTLIREHFKRLWFPDPDGDGYVPTRDAFPMNQDEFDALMPREFWAEVLEELNKSSPDTLMMAEAFWLMEKYFIRELGMHRVYNSAFLNQMRDEENKQLRGYFREILESDPTLLDHFVNYMTTPDEKPAAGSFGKSYKYFGVCGLMAALPGLPLFGHGQLEGLEEHYGMDFCRPLMDERLDDEFLNTHNRLITPLLKQRQRFSDASHLVMYDFLDNRSALDENVFAFSNRTDAGKSMIIYNNCDKRSAGHITQTGYVPWINSQPASNPLSLVQGLELNDQVSAILTELRSDTTQTISILDLAKSGLALSLDPYQLLVFDVR